MAFTPDNTKLFITGSFNSVNGTTRKGIASLNLTTGAPLPAFTADLGARGSEVVATNSTLYIGGRFTKVNGVARVGWQRSTPTPARSTPASSTTSPAASASTVPSPSSAW